MSHMSTQQSSKASQAIQGYLGRTGLRTEAKDTGDAWRIGKIFVQNIEEIWKGAQRLGILDFDWCRSKDEMPYPPSELTSRGVVGGPPIEGHRKKYILSSFLFGPNRYLEAEDYFI